MNKLQMNLSETILPGSPVDFHKRYSDGVTSTLICYKITPLPLVIHGFLRQSITSDFHDAVSP